LEPVVSELTALGLKTLEVNGMNGEKMRYKVILLLAVGLAAFSSAMKELNQVQQFALDASHLAGQLAESVAPNPVPPQTPEVPQAPVQTCEIKQSLPTVELPWLDHDKAPRAVTPRPSQVIDLAKVERHFNRVKTNAGLDAAELRVTAKLKKLPQFDINPVAFEFTIPADHDADPVFKMKTRRHDVFIINPRDREFLKTLNRSINLRSAS
jgi:hypothetical protein